MKLYANIFFLSLIATSIAAEKCPKKCTKTVTMTITTTATPTPTRPSCTDTVCITSTGTGCGYIRGACYLHPVRTAIDTKRQPLTDYAYDLDLWWYLFYGTVYPYHFILGSKEFLGQSLNCMNQSDIFVTNFMYLVHLTSYVFCLFHGYLDATQVIGAPNPSRLSLIARGRLE
jgi:hypothetical protein